MRKNGILYRQQRPDTVLCPAVLCLAALCLAILSLTGCQGPAGSSEDKYTDQSFVMDTVLSQTLYGSKDLTSEIETLLINLEKKELSWREPASQISGVNEKLKAGKGAGMTADFLEWTQESLELAHISQGAFDPSIGKLTELWDIEGDKPVVPPKESVSTILNETGYQKMRIENGTLTMDGTGTLDLGAVGKGIACDEVKEYLTARTSVKSAVIAVGGSVLTYGDKPDGDAWQVAVQDPRGQDGSPMGVISIQGSSCISTSGDYEKYFIEKGKRYHHILDPSTGYPADSGLISVTVVCENGLMSDGLSTACFVLGKEKGKKLLEDCGAQGVFIDDKKQVTLTDGIHFSLLNSEYSIIE